MVAIERTSAQVSRRTGTIGLTSAVGRGSTFTIRLPLDTVPAALTAAN